MERTLALNQENWGIFPDIKPPCHKCSLNECMDNNFPEMVFKSLVTGGIRAVTTLQGSPED